jgi:ElaB/YqjD/DUF883 family membrane-anchored ribosome-binding protein
MTVSNSPLVTPLPRKDNGNGTGTAPPDDDRLAHLRAELAVLTQSIADMTAKRAAQIEELATSGAASLRSTIEARPWTALAVAATAGALLAVAVTPKSSRGLRASGIMSYAPDDISASVRRAIAHGVDTQPITSRFERLVDSISSIDASALTSSPAYDTAKTWLQSFVSGLRKT